MQDVSDNVSVFFLFFFGPVPGLRSRETKESTASGSEHSTAAAAIDGAHQHQQISRGMATARSALDSRAP